MKSIVCGIYEILNTINNKRYIGQSIDIYHRWIAHKNKLRRNNHFNDYLQRAWNKYGERSFKFNIIEICPQNMLDDRECYYINLYNTTDRDKGYNLKPGGAGANPSIEARQKMSDAQKNRWTEELKQELRLKYTGENNPFYGKTHTEDVGRKIAEANRKRVWTEESKKKTSESLKGRTPYNLGKSTPQDVRDKISMSLKGRPSVRKKAVVQLTKDGQYIGSFDSLTEASLQTGIKLTSISSCCRGDFKSAGGYLWVYQDAYNETNSYVYEDTRNKPVVQLDLNGIFVAEYNSVKEAHDITGLNSESIGQCCRGKSKTAGGYQWLFKINYISNIISNEKGELLCS